MGGCLFSFPFLSFPFLFYSVLSTRDIGSHELNDFERITSPSVSIACIFSPTQPLLNQQKSRPLLPSAFLTAPPPHLLSTILTLFATYPKPPPDFSGKRSALRNRRSSGEVLKGTQNPENLSRKQERGLEISAMVVIRLI